MRDIITFLILFSLNVHASDDVNTVRFAISALQNIDKPFEIHCGQAEISSKECPYMFKQFQRDQDTGWFSAMVINSPWNSCKSSAPSSSYITPKELELSLASSNSRNLGLNEGYFSSKISKCYEYNKGNSTTSQTHQNAVISLSYNYLNSLKEQTKNLSNEIVNINSLLEIADVSDGIPCDQFYMPLDAKMCKDLKNQKCRPQGGISKISTDLMTGSIEPIVAIAQKMQKIRRMSSGRGSSPNNRKEYKELQAKIDFIKAENPLLSEGLVSDFINDIAVDQAKMPSVDKLTSVIKNQLQQNKKAIGQKLQIKNKVAGCILYGDKKNCEDFNDNLADVPPDTKMNFNREKLLSGKETKMKELAREELYSNIPSCMARTREIKDGFNSFAGETAINVGLTVATMGAGAVVIKAGQLGKVALAARAANAVSLAGDMSFLGVSVNNAIEECNKSLNHLEGHARQTETIQCPKSINSPEYNAVSGVRECVSAALLASIDALPFTPAIAHKFKSAPKVAEAIKTSPKKPSVADLLEKQMPSNPKMRTKTKELEEHGIPNGDVTAFVKADNGMSILDKSQKAIRAHSDVWLAKIGKSYDDIAKELKEAKGSPESIERMYNQYGGIILDQTLKDMAKKTGRSLDDIYKDLGLAQVSHGTDPNGAFKNILESGNLIGGTEKYGAKGNHAYTVSGEKSMDRWDTWNMGGGPTKDWSAPVTFAAPAGRVKKCSGVVSALLKRTMPYIKGKITATQGRADVKTCMTVAGHPPLAPKEIRIKDPSEFAKDMADAGYLAGRIDDNTAAFVIVGSGTSAVGYGAYSTGAFESEK